MQQSDALTATDDVGNRNNIVRTEITPEEFSPNADPAATAKEKRWGPKPGAQPRPDLSKFDQHEKEPEPLSTRQERQDSVQLPSIPVPFVTVDKAQDKEQPEYGGIVESESLHSNASKRTAHADPDFESTLPASPVDTKKQQSPSVPLLVVEKTDYEPSFGDDFGENATAAQKEAHDMRNADTSPNEVVVTEDSEAHIEPGAEQEKEAPLLPHESFNSGVPRRGSEPQSPNVGEDAPKEAPAQTKHSEAQEDAEEHAPLFSYEAGDSDIRKSSQPQPPGMATIDEESPRSSPGRTDNTKPTNESAPSSAQDNSSSNEDRIGHETTATYPDELDFAPRLSHEADFPADDNDFSELDQAPLMPHETDLSMPDASSQFSKLRRRLNDEDDSFDVDERESSDFVRLARNANSQPFDTARSPTFSHEDLHEDTANLDEAPLLPHERSGPSSEQSGSESGRLSFKKFDDDPSTASPIFGPHSSFNIFQRRSNSSSLPHRLPRSDEEDKDLHDPSLEAFPTSRHQILERVSTISNQLPEDEAVASPFDTYSPAYTVSSQACSSVDLAPIGSHVSLRAFSDDALLEADEEEDAANPPPALKAGGRDTTSGQHPCLLCLTSDNEKPDLPSTETHSQTHSDNPKHSSVHHGESSTEGNVQRNDGAGDSSQRHSAFSNKIAQPSNVLQHSVVDGLLSKLPGTSAREGTSDEKDDAHVGEKTSTQGEKPAASAQDDTTEPAALSKPGQADTDASNEDRQRHVESTSDDRMIGTSSFLVLFAH